MMPPTRRAPALAALLLCAAAAAAAHPGAARADSITLNTVDRGSYGRSGYHNAADNAYATGAMDGYRSFFLFNVAGLDPDLTVVAARLQLHNPRGGAEGVAPFTLHDVDTPAATLVQSHAAATGVYADLGTGTSYGSIVDATAPVVTVELNANFLAAINARNADLLAMGGKLGDEHTAAYAFGNTASCFGGPQLILDFGPPLVEVPPAVPLPGIAAAGVALLGLKTAARTRRRPEVER